MKKENSWNQYHALAKVCRKQKLSPSSEELEELLKAVEEELLTYGQSPLLNAAWQACRQFLREQKCRVSLPSTKCCRVDRENRKGDIPPYTAWYLCILTAEYLSGGRIQEDFFEEGAYFYGEYYPVAPDVEALLQAFQIIDEAIGRKKQATREIPTVAGLPQEIQEQRNRLLQEARKEAEEIRRRAAQEAEDQCRETDRKCKELLSLAQREAGQILTKADREAQERIAQAQRRLLDLGAAERTRAQAQEQQAFQEGFALLRETLMEVNEGMKTLEDAQAQQMTRKAAGQYLELYNLIADTRDSAQAQARQTKNQDLENAAFNMEVFLDMICEYLADYGIQTLTSCPGDKFQGKLHSLKKTDPRFDPRTAAIGKSLRRGFLWGEQVLQKELVSL